MKPSDLTGSSYYPEQTRLQQIQTLVKKYPGTTLSVAALTLATTLGFHNVFDEGNTGVQQQSDVGITKAPTPKTSELPVPGKKALQAAMQLNDPILDVVKDVEANMPKIVLDNPQIFEFLDGYLDGNDTYGTMYVKLSQKLQRLKSLYEEDDAFTKNIHLEMRYRLDNGIVPASELMIQVLEQAEYKKVALTKLIEAFQRLSPTEEDMGKMNELLIVFHTEADGTWNREDWEKWGNAMKKEREGVEEQIKKQEALFQQNSTLAFDKQNVPICKK